MKKALTLALQDQSDQYILRGIRRLIATDWKRKADFLIYLNEVEQRKLYAEEGYSSLFRWLTEAHHLSESTALKRIQVAHLAKKFTFLYEGISRGEYSLSVLSRLSHFIRHKNAHLLFTAAKNKSVREVEAMLAEKFPKEDVEERLQKNVSPLGLDRYSVQFNADKEFIDDLQELKGLLSHRFPQGRLKDVFGAAVKKMLVDIKKDRQPRTAAPSQDHIPRGIQNNAAANETSHIPRGIQNTSEIPRSTKAPRSRHIPDSVRRAVEERDQHRCQHHRPDGTLCGETHFLEVDHLRPFALGGTHQPENLRLLCWAHNALRAERQFGKRCWTKKSRPASPA